MSPILATEVTILVLLLIACFGAVYFQRFHLPYTVGLVIAGLLLGWGENLGLPIQHLILSPDLILFTFVPPLVFASASNIDHRLLFKNLTPTLTLAGPGLVISVAIIGGLLFTLTPLSLGNALLFGALISATDPVAVVALFEELGVPKRLNILVDGESLLNDATAIVAFDVVLSVIQSGVFDRTTIPKALVQVVVVLLGGIIVGLLTGSLMRVFIGLAKDNPLIQATVSLLVAYIAFIIAQNYLDVSGVIAVMTAGLIVGRYKAYRLQPEIRNYLDSFWSYVAFLANSLIFLLVGLTSSAFILKLPLTQPKFWVMIIAAIAISLIARGVMIFSLVPVLNLFLKAGSISWQYQLVSFWGGLRGAVALALALSLAPDFPDRGVLIAMTLGVALFTILVGGTTAGNLIHFLKLDIPPLINTFAEKQVNLSVQQEAIQQFDILKKNPLLPSNVVANLEKEYEPRVEQARADLHQVQSQIQADPDLNLRVLWLESLSIESQTYEDAYAQGILSVRTFNQLQFLVESKEDKINTGQILLPDRVSDYWQPSWEDCLSVLVAHFSPDSWWVQQERNAQIQSHYEFNLVVAAASQKVIEKFKEWKKMGLADPQLANNCINYYQKVWDKARELIQNTETQQQRLNLEVQRRIIQQVVSSKMKKHLERIERDGIVSEDILKNIKLNS